MSRGSTAFHNGMAAEDIAARAYEAKGGKVLAQRWKVPEGEIDLIVELAGVIVFVEVKARKNMAAALGALQPAQQTRLMACAEQYLAQKADLNTACRFDLAALDHTGRIEIIENALG
ncbi:MAG: YraN family protein [Rhodobacteraceae bacterium]|nr:YraN family protein [Paracoccaceae bacterium]